MTVNIVTFFGADEDLEKVTERLYSPGVTNEDDYCFDFRKIIPVPRELYCICYNNGLNSDGIIIHGRKYEQWYYVNLDGEMIKKDPDDDPELSTLKGMSSKMKKQFMRKYGALNSSKWIGRNWGAQSNSIGPRLKRSPDKLVYNFCTNYGSARLIILEIESMIYRGEFPKVKMMWEHDNVDVHLCFMEDDDYVPDPTPVFTVGFAETEKSTSEYYKCAYYMAN
jgi:hypothetical protein